MMTHADLFSGIGGFIAAAKITGLKTLFSCEIDPWLNKLLAQNYPGIIQFRDIKEMIHEKLPAVDILTASPPCQPVSQAGKRAGSRDDRFLWNETIAIIRKIRPRWFIIENVPGFASMVEFDRELPVDAEGVPFGNVGDLVHRSGRGVGAKILETLNSYGYEIQVFDIPAAGVDAPHLRHRLWIVGHSGGCGLPGHQWRQDGKEFKTRCAKSTGTISDITCTRGRELPAQSGKENIDIDGSGQEIMADAYSRKRSLYWFITGMGRQKQSTQKNDTNANGAGNPRKFSVCKIFKSFAKKRKKRIEPGRMDSKRERKFTKFASRDIPRRWTPEPPVPRVAYGIPNRVHRIKGLGNAIVPQVAEVLFRYILEIEKKVDKK